MYTTFYGLTEYPFNITPDSKFMYWSATHQEAFRHLVYSVQSGKGLILLTGKPGTGKTALLNALIGYFQEPERRAHIVFIVNSKIKIEDLFRWMFNEFGLEGVEAQRKSDYLIVLEEFLVKCAHENQKVLLILDEAQNFSPDLLEEIRLLSNIETAKEKLLQIILAGQPLLAKKLNSPHLLQVKQRIGISYHLVPLTYTETMAYIKRRLEVAGAKDLDLFSLEAVEEIYRYTQGIPRMVNILCDNALLFGFAVQKKPIDREIILQVIEYIQMEETQQIQDSGLPHRKTKDTSRKEPLVVPERRDRSEDTESSSDSIVIEMAKRELKETFGEPGGFHRARKEGREASRRIKKSSIIQRRSVQMGVLLLVALLVLGGMAWQKEARDIQEWVYGGVQDLLQRMTTFFVKNSPAPSERDPTILRPDASQQQNHQREAQPVAPLPAKQNFSPSPPADLERQREVVSAQTPAVSSLSPREDFPPAESQNRAVGSTPGQANTESSGNTGAGSLQKTAPQPKIITVKEGEALAGILLREYGTYNETILSLVREANPEITNINLINVGQRIILPPLSR